MVFKLNEYNPKLQDSKGISGNILNFQNM